MINFYMRIVCFVVVLILLAVPQAEAAPVSCPALLDDKVYTKEKKSYQYLVEGKDGWLFRSKTDVKTDFSIDEKTLGYFKSFQQALSEKGVGLYITMPPTRGIMHDENFPEQSDLLDGYDRAQATSSYNQSIETLRQAGVKVPSFSDVLDQNILFFHLRDHHWAAPGARVSAQKVAPLVKEDFPDLPHKIYQSEISTPNQKIPGSFEKFVEKVCGFEITDEQTEAYVTVAADEDDEEALFGDEVPAEVVLVGTSNCTEPNPSYANFAGFLREELSSPVDNVSIGGGGIETPIISYLASEDYNQKKHNALIWELASHYNYNGSKFQGLFRQAVPAVYGFCGESALIQNEYNLTSDEGGLFPQLSEKPVPVNGSYIAMKFDKPVRKDFGLSVRYVSGEGEMFRFERSNRYPHDGIYFLSLEGPEGAEVSSMVLLPEEGFEADSVHVEICTY